MMRTVLDRLARWLWPLAVANLVVNIGIVVTGGAVRLTGSGLGCPSWPKCDETSYTTHGELGMHGVIEFGNRMLTFVLVAVAVLCFVAALGAGHRAAIRLSTIVALGVPAQALIGGVTVLTELNPWVVAFHFLCSMAIVMVCVALLDSIRGPERAATHGLVGRATWLVLGVTWVVLYLGTVVTGSGPHSGDLESRRTGLDPQVMSHVHAAAVYVLLAVTVGVYAAAHRAGATRVRTAAGLLLVLSLAQGVLGFVQYFTDLPELLVGLHMLGAAVIAAGAAWVWLSARARQR